MLHPGGAPLWLVLLQRRDEALLICVLRPGCGDIIDNFYRLIFYSNPGGSTPMRSARLPFEPKRMCQAPKESIRGGMNGCGACAQAVGYY